MENVDLLHNAFFLEEDAREPGGLSKTWAIGRELQSSYDNPDLSVAHRSPITRDYYFNPLS